MWWVGWSVCVCVERWGGVCVGGKVWSVLCVERWGEVWGEGVECVVCGEVGWSVWGEGV